MNKVLLLLPRDCRNTRGGGDADIQSPACNVHRSPGYPRVPLIYNKSTRGIIFHVSNRAEPYRSLVTTAIHFV